ncbi:uncharacterized protein LOC133819787 isoform X2 [Humulus lupulus]|uniref:uncharacterized protein LOC133819787 isoform X2 n=1 Tax=Humulus lupulus TaxID=3486 RepID=UPI002B416A0B|nr:uncharacterized protein LOC133819787 isoform X2 [Humulus lupulus]
MEFHRFYLLVILSILCSQSRAETTGSVFFIDSSSNQFFRKATDDVTKPDLILDTEAGAAVSVLLGFAPPSTLSAASSTKLNQILVPNPFNRPRAVFMLEVRGVDDSELLAKDNAISGSILSSKIAFGSEKSEIQLPAEDEVSVVSLDEPFADLTDKEISTFASWMGGVYDYDTAETLNGELIIPLANGANMKLHMSKKADREFTASLLSLVRNLRNAMDMHEDLSHGTRSPAELLTGSFDGIKILREQYRTEGSAQHGMELLLSTLSKIYNELQDAYKGQIVGVIFCSGEASMESSKMLDVSFAPQRSGRLLEENKLPRDTVLEVLLVRGILAWTTGIILLVSTLIGICFLFNMPLTRDTLLYSNVKLD